MSAQSRYPRFVRDQRSFFDKLITEDWDSYASQEWDRTRLWEISRLFELTQPRRILDVGCGCGFHDAAMGVAPHVERIDSVDYSVKSVEKANETYPHPKVNRWVADFRDWTPSPDYDLVVSFQVIEHLDDPEEFLKFCRLATSIGGHVAVFTPNRLRLTNVKRMLKLKQPELCDPQHYREYSIGEIKALGRSVGLRAAASFGYQLHGFNFIDRLDTTRRLCWGSRLRPVATNIAVLFKVE